MNLIHCLVYIRTSLGAHVPIVLLTPPPVDTLKWKRHNQALQRDPSYRANHVAKAYGDRVKAVADAHDCLLVDVFELLGGEELAGPHLSDGLHLSGSGNEMVYSGLMQLLDKEQMSPMQITWDQYIDTVPVRMRPSIVLFGDSLTQKGFEDRGWVSLLAAAYSRRADVLNRGFQGYNTRAAVQAIASCLWEEGTDGALFVTVWFGANDAFPPDDERHVPLQEFEENLRAIVTNIR